MAEYPNLEPNHQVQTDAEGHRVIMCPFERTDIIGVEPDGEVVAQGLVLWKAPITQTAMWSPHAAPEEVQCPVCEVLNGDLTYVGSECGDLDEGS